MRGGSDYLRRSGCSAHGGLFVRRRGDGEVKGERRKVGVLLKEMPYGQLDKRR